MEWRGNRVALGESDRGIRGWVNSFSPTLCLSLHPDNLTLIKSAGIQGARGNKSPLKAIILGRELLSSTILSIFFTLFLAILGKLGLVDILVRLTNKLYPTQHYFGVYAWMFL